MGDQEMPSLHPPSHAACGGTNRWNEKKNIIVQPDRAHSNSIEAGIEIKSFEPNTFCKQGSNTMLDKHSPKS